MDETIATLADCFNDVTDPRIDRTKLHKLADVIVMAICAVVASCDMFETIEVFCGANEQWFK